MNFIDISLYVFTFISILWSILVVCPVLFASHYEQMRQNWNKTSPLNQLLGVIATIVAIIFIICIALTDVILTIPMKLALIAPIFVIFSFFTIYIRSIIKL
jgi:high-affinity nickel permease